MTCCAQKSNGGPHQDLDANDLKFRQREIAEKKKINIFAL
jgi:hypothetical protein